MSVLIVDARRLYFADRCEASSASTCGASRLKQATSENVRKDIPIRNGWMLVLFPESEVVCNHGVIACACLSTPEANQDAVANSYIVKLTGPCNDPSH